MKNHNWGVKIKALVLAFIMMFALASNAFAASRCLENVGTRTQYVSIYVKKGQTVEITNLGGKNLQIYNGATFETALNPGKARYYKAQKTGTYRFGFQTTFGGNGSTTRVGIVTGGTFK